MGLTLASCMAETTDDIPLPDSMPLFVVEENQGLYEYASKGPITFESSKITNSDNEKVENLRLGGAEVVYNHEFVGVALSKQGYAGCTSSIIGPNTLITAAHCVDVGGEPAQTSDLTLRLSNDVKSEYAFECSINENYGNAMDRRSFLTAEDQIAGVSTGPRNSYDVALCFLTSHEEIERKNDESFFEVIDLDYIPKTQQRILMVGRGCAASKQENGALRMDQVDGHLRVGDARVSDVPKPGNELLTIIDNDGNRRQILQPSSAVAGRIESRARIDGPEAYLCPVDSGGPVFNGVTTANYNEPRRIIAVNSSAGHVDEFEVLSIFAKLNSPVIHSFFDEFLEKNPEAQICGKTLRAGTNGCRE